MGAGSARAHRLMELAQPGQKKEVGMEEEAEGKDQKSRGICGRVGMCVWGGGGGG